MSFVGPWLFVSSDEWGLFRTREWLLFTLTSVQAFCLVSLRDEMVLLNVFETRGRSLTTGC